MNDLLRTLAMNSLFMIRDMMLIILEIIKFEIPNSKGCGLEFGIWIFFILFFTCYSLDENIIDAWDFLHKMRDLSSLC